VTRAPFTSPTPALAIVVPVHQDPDQLRRLFTAIAAVDYPTDHRAVIVGVDGADPATAAVAREQGAEVVLLEPRRGSYAARNAALERLAPEAEIVVFTDADCIPTAGWLRGHVVALADADLSGGAITVTVRPKASPAEFVDRQRPLHQEAYVTRDGYAATANLAVRRAVVEAQHFDDGLQTGGDVEFCQRATKNGFRLVYSPAAEVQHPARQTVGELFKKVRRIVGGVAARPQRWDGREIAKPRPRRALTRIARAEGVSRGLLWDVQAVALEYVASLMLYRAVRRVQRSGIAAPPPQGPPR
jgi:GT2 family glycosyltransferase